MAAELHTLDQRRLIDSNGIADGSTIDFYLTGTTARTSIYSDETLETPLTNPVVVPAGAEVPNIYLDDAVIYRRVITYSDGSVDETDPYIAPYASSGALADVSAKAGEVISLTTYQADGGGTVVDTVPLQSLAAAVGTYSGDLGKGGYLPSGLYRLDATIVPQSYSRLHGDGPHQSVLFNQISTIPTIPAFTASGSLTFATIENLGARGQKSFIDVTGVTDHNTFRNVVATGMADAGFRFRNFLQTSLFDRIMVESSPFGVVCESGICNRNTFREPEFKDLTDSSFKLAGSEDLLIIGGRFEGSGDAAKAVFDLEGTQEIHVLGGYFEGCHKTIVDWATSPEGTVTFDGSHFTYFSAGVTFLWNVAAGGQLIFRNCRSTIEMEVPAGSIVENCINIYAAPPEVASAAEITIPRSSFVRITGTTNITSITSGNEFGSLEATLVFAAALTVVNGGNLNLRGDFKAYAGATLTLVYDNALAAWVEKARSNTLAGSATYDAPSIAASGTTTTTVTVTGAALGDFAEVSFGVSLAGLICTAYVSAADTVTVALFNPTVGAVDLASTTVRARVRK